jgi:spore maturation protein CgeB
MRILFVADEWDYGDRARGHSFEYDTLFQTLVKEGHDAHLLDVGTLRALPANEVDRAVRSAVARVEPELVFCFLFKTEIPPATLARVRDEDGVPVVNWFADDHWRYDDFSRAYAPSLTLSVTTSSSAAARYEADGYRHLFSQWGYAHLVYGVPDPAVAPVPTVVFVGQPYGERAGTLESLEQALPNGSSVDVYGHGSTLGRVTAPEMIRLFNTSAAAVNFSSSWQPGILDRLKRGRLRRRHVPPQLKARVFEVTGAGGLLLTQPSEDLERYFEGGREIVIFETLGELVEAAREALANGEWRQAVARAGFERCHAEHTMSHRLRDVLTAVGP